MKRNGLPAYIRYEKGLALMNAPEHTFIFFDMTEGMPNVDIKTFPYTPFASRECSFHTSGALHTHFTHNEELGVNVVQPDWQRY